jgi:hypothetical protein
LERRCPPAGQHDAISAHHHDQATGDAVPAYRLQIRPHQRFATGQHNHGRMTHCANLVEHLAHCLSIQFIRIWLLQRICIQIAMGAGKITSAGQIESQ